MSPSDSKRFIANGPADAGEMGLKPSASVVTRLWGPLRPPSSRTTQEVETRLSSWTWGDCAVRAGAATRAPSGQRGTRSSADGPRSRSASQASWLVGAQVPLGHTDPRKLSQPQARFSSQTFL